MAIHNFNDKQQLSSAENGNFIVGETQTIFVPDTRNIAGKGGQEDVKNEMMEILSLSTMQICA